MTDAAVIAGSYTDLKFLSGLKSARITVEIPIEHAQKFIDAFGVPNKADPARVALARLNESACGSDEQTPAAPPHKEGREGRNTGASGKLFRERPRSSQAFLMLQNPEFAKWLASLRDVECDDAEKNLKVILSIESKTELDTNPDASARWDKCLTSFDYRNSKQ